MSTDQQEKNPYELLDLGLEASEQDIRSAYRKLSLKVHPDRNPNNPDAAQKFHELNQAYELLLDPLRRLALNSSVKAAEARKARFSKLDKRKREMQDALEEAERAAKKQHADRINEKARREAENERVKEAGRKMREERIEVLKKREETERRVEEAREQAEDEDEVPALGQLDTTVKLRYTLSTHPDLTSSSAVASLLAQFGEIDVDSVVLSLRPPKKAPMKPPKGGTSLIPFRKIGSAFAAVSASGVRERGLEGINVSWAGGEEPPILAWLKKKGKLGSAIDLKKNETSKVTNSGRPPPGGGLGIDLNIRAASPEGSAYSSFPEVLPTLNSKRSDGDVPPSLGPGLDYESLTLMRLRQAERERLEREIREQEGGED